LEQEVITNFPKACKIKARDQLRKRNAKQEAVFPAVMSRTIPNNENVSKEKIPQNEKGLTNPRNGGKQQRSLSRSQAPHVAKVNNAVFPASQALQATMGSNTPVKTKG
jgi:hypothetical protein